MSKYIFSFPYLLVAGILFCLYIIEQNKKRINKSTTKVSWIAFFILLIFLGLRGHIYTDFIVYYQYFNNLTPTNWTDLGSGYEIGFEIYSRIIKYFFPNYYCWIFINTFIDLLVLRFTFKRYATSTILPFIFFLAFQGVLMEANLLRNFKALDCFLLSLPYLQSKKIIKYTLLNILGATFHISSLLYLPLFFILTVNIHKYVIWIIFIVITLIYWLKIHVTSSIIGYILAGSEKYVGYLESDSGFGFTLGYFERTFTFLLFTFLYKRLIIQKKSNNIFYNCSFLYYSFHILFNDIAVVAERIPFLFIIGNWVLYTNVINCKYRAKQVINVAIGILVFLKIVLSFSNIGTKYQNILFGIDSYESRAKECLEIAIDFDNGRNH